MPFEKGHNLSKGRQPGSQNKKTKAWDELADYITGDGSERYLKLIRKLKDEDFSKKYETLLEFFKPKRQRTEISGKLETGPKKIGIKKEDK